MLLGPRTALAGAILVLALANVLNNWIAPAAYVVTAVVASAALLALLRSTGGTWADAGLGRDTMRRGVTWGLLLGAGATAVVLAAVLAPPTRQLFLDPRVEGTSAAAIAFAALVRVPLGTVLLEEIGFRGVVYALAGRMWGLTWATVFSSVLFGLWHVQPAIGVVTSHPTLRGFNGALAAAAAVLVATLIGAAMCELRRRSGSLLAPAALHWTANALGYVAAHLVLRS
jgi:membrane protease YdiL (CAAX protease family)